MNLKDEIRQAELDLALHATFDTRKITKLRKLVAECKHDWESWLSTNTYCVECGTKRYV